MKNKALPCILNNPCQNGATCTNDNIGGYTCECATGYTGTNCDTLFFLSNWPLLPIV